MKKFFKKVPIVVWILIILIGTASIIFYFKPFLICPSWLHKNYNVSPYWKSFYCRNNNYEYLILKDWDSDWHLTMDCNNWKCIEYDSNGSFNPITWIKNFIKWIWSWYQPWDIKKIWNRKSWEYWAMIPNWPYYEYKNWILITSWTKIDTYKWIWEWYYYNEDWSLKIIIDYWDDIDWNFLYWEYWDIFNRKFSFFYKNGNPSVKWEYLSWYATWLRTRYDKDWNITNTYDYNKKSIECPKWYNEIILSNSWYIYAQFCENKEWIRSWEYIKFHERNWTIIQRWMFSGDMKEWLRINYNNWVWAPSKKHYVNDIPEGKFESYYDNWELTSSFYMVSWYEDRINHPSITYHKNWNIYVIYNNNEYVEWYENWNVKIRWKYNNLNEKIWTRYYYKENWKLDYKKIYDHWFIVE